MAQFKGPASFTYYPSGGQDTGLVRSFKEDAAQTFIRGDLVFLAATGELGECGTDPLKILGIAMDDSTGVTGSNILVNVIRPNDQFKASFENAFVLADTMAPLEISTPAAGRWRIDDATGANLARVVLIDSLEYSADGLLESQAGGAVICTFLHEDGTSLGILQFSGGR